jgi:hypothetical protein
MFCGLSYLAQCSVISNLVVTRMATADAKLLPPPPFPAAPDSDQNLDSVGPLAVLGAMVEQRRASRPAPEELQGVIEEEEEDDGSADETQPRKVPMYSDAFIKVR